MSCFLFSKRWECLEFKRNKIMKTIKDELTRLNEIVNASNIYQAITALDMMLRMYEHSPRVKHNCYTVMTEMETIREKLTEVKNLLEWNIKNAEEWEKVHCSNA